MFKPRWFIVLAVISFLAGCSSVTATPTAAPTTLPTPVSLTATIPATNTAAPSATASAAPSGTPSPVAVAATGTPTQTSTATPIPRKPVLVAYSNGPGDGSDEIYVCLKFLYDYAFVLYTDGQLIFLTHNGLFTTTLTQVEMDALLQQIKGTGLLAINGDGSLREKDPIYSIPASIDVGDGAPSSELQFENKRFSIYYPLEPYLVEPIKRTLEIVQRYRLARAQRYIPMLVNMWIYELTDPTMVDTPVATPIPPIDEWPSNLPPLNDLEHQTNYNFASLDAEETQAISGMFSVYPSSRVLTQSGTTYYVLACPELP